MAPCTVVHHDGSTDRRGSQINRTCVSPTNSDAPFDSALSIIQITHIRLPVSHWSIYPSSKRKRIAAVGRRSGANIRRPSGPPGPSSPHPQITEAQLNTKGQAQVRRGRTTTHTRTHSHSPAAVRRTCSLVRMSSVSARAPVAALRPAASASSPRFLGDSGRVGLAKSTRRDVAVQAKGSWLPGLPSPAYLDGRSAQITSYDAFLSSACSCCTVC
jgi:hypothetical protein